ncbi:MULTISPECIES: zonular occludens toxin domain-containing protein [Halomonas]|uniref:zonular occludens toxin domain-containing protein n=2 Tax=Halomonadaceae TaxID=28256 RepID=UPI0025B2D01E|nr:MULTISPECIES: zonular occludens toxin domain-containing protein [Halomonas]MDR5891155.1 zonular occludens toxin domain-containing protein [Halomonas salina]WJY08213.1 zonular occludens toxin domain-containing protein [Halomonas halophila]
MSLHLITAVPGAGKTLRAIWMTLKLMDEHPDRPVFSNINGWNRAAPIPDEWMDCPDGSVIVLDECQQRWRRYRNTGTPPAEIAELETHRHRGIDFILTCQNPSQVTSDVRALVEVHEHLMRRGKMGGALVYRFEGVCHTNPMAHKGDADCEVSVWKHPKEVFAEYTSASIHTGTRRLPRILIIAPFVFLGSAGAVVYAANSVTGFLGVDSQAEAEDAAPASSTAPVAPPPETVTAHGGLRKDDYCQLYDQDGKPIRTTIPDCLNAMELGLPYDVEVLKL